MISSIPSLMCMMSNPIFGLRRFLRSRYRTSYTVPGLNPLWMMSFGLHPSLVSLRISSITPRELDIERQG